MRWARNQHVIMPRVGDDGVAHLMGLLHPDVGGPDLVLDWSRRCDRERMTRPTRAATRVTCMECLVTPDANVRKHGARLTLRYPATIKSRSVVIDGLLHEAWTMGDWDAWSACGLRFYLPVAEQSTLSVSCLACLAAR